MRYPTSQERMLGRTRNVCRKRDAADVKIKSLFIATYNKPGRHIEKATAIRHLTSKERMLGRTRSACEEGDAVGQGLMIATYNRPGQHMQERKGSMKGGGLGKGRDLVAVRSSASVESCVWETLRPRVCISSLPMRGATS